jgi:hypothetical protein
MSNVKEIIKQEYIKCVKDPAYFMRKYCQIQHPQRGRIQFNLYPFQEKVLGILTKNDRNIILKSRQLGISTLVGGQALWLMLFHKDKNILVIATTQATAKNLVTKVRVMYDNLPSWLKLKNVEHNRLSLRLVNGSQVKAIAASENAARSEAISLLILDEAAFVEPNKIDPIWASAQQTLATGGKCIMLSTPNGTGNLFHRTWAKAQEKENDFIPLRLPWDIHPERDQAWRDQQDEELGERLAAQECDCNFLTSGNSVIPPEVLEFYEKTYVQDPIERRGVDSNYWVWEYPDYSKTYMVVADVARGDAKDYSAFHIIDIENSVQVATFKSQIGTKDFGNILVSVATEYNNALLVIENANIGWAVLQQVIDRGYQNIYYSPKEDKTQDAESWIAKGYDILDKSKMTPGFTMSNRTRPLVIAKLDAYLKDKSLIVKCSRTLEELRTFIWKNGRPEAQHGYNDDLTMSLGTSCYVRDTALKFSQHGIDLTRAALNNIKKTNNDTKTFYTAHSKEDPWNMKHGKDNIDLRWLL